MGPVVRVKVCGVTRPEDAAMVEAAGAHAVGLVFAPSKRQLSPEQAAAVSAALGPFVARVGVFVDEEPERVLELAALARLSALQLHGDEPPEHARRLARHYPVIKAFRLKGPPPAELFSYPADAYLLDGPRPGSGRAFDWDWLGDLPPGRRVIVAGGLTPENVCSLLHRYRPYGVDTSSGVESAPGVKDWRRIAAFVRAVESCG